MFWLGKLIGSVFGYMIAGPFGAVFGLLLGHYFDLSRKGHWFFLPPPKQQTQTQNIFFQATFTIMGYIAKADGRVSENEIRVATRIMQNMQLTPSQKQQAINYFRQGKQANIDLNVMLAALRQACFPQHNLLHLFVDIQVQAAYADGILTRNKQQILERICYSLGLNPSNFFYSFYQHTHYSNKGYQYSHQQYRAQSKPNSLESAYRILGVTSSTSETDVKKAYRKLMSQNHPDKLVSKGLPEEMIKIANQKTQEIKFAYETIRKTRGFK